MFVIEVQNYIFWKMINPNVRYTAVNGMALVSTANPNLNGSGTLVQIILSPSSNGTFINRIIIKAIENTTRGMIRLFVNDHGLYYLLKEIPVKAVDATASEIDSTYFRTIVDLNFTLKSSSVLMASTEKGENFQIFVEGLSWNY